MTARGLIDSIFSRPAWMGMSPDLRRITPEQLKFMTDLVAKDAERASVQRGRGRSFVWTPSGPHKFVITEDPTGGDKHTLLRVPNLAKSESGSLF
jgi:hypothetical protein